MYNYSLCPKINYSTIGSYYGIKAAVATFDGTNWISSSSINTLYYNFGTWYVTSTIKDTNRHYTSGPEGRIGYTISYYTVDFQRPALTANYSMLKEVF